VILLWWWHGYLFAGDIIHSEIRDEGDNYIVQLEMQIDAPTQRVYQLLTDFAHLHQLSDSIVDSEVLARNNNKIRIKVVSRGCVLFFCRTVNQFQTVTELYNGYIMLIDENGKSDFKYGHTLWRVQQIDGGTRVTISADLQPDFWIPPIIGTYLFKKKLLKEGTMLVNNLEQLANHAP